MIFIVFYVKSQHVMDVVYCTMAVFKEEQFSSAHLGHLGLVADKIDCLNIVDLIDRRLPVSKAYAHL